MQTENGLPQGQKSLLELGPILIFLVILYAGRLFGLEDSNDRFFYATVVLVPLALTSLGYIWFRERKTPWLLLVSTVLLTVFGSITILTGGDPVWLKVKLTAVSLIYAGGLGLTWLLGFPILEKLFGANMSASRAEWLRAAALMALGSLLAAGANEVIWALTNPDFWAFAGKIGLAVFQFIFTGFALYPIVVRTAREQAEAEAAETAEAAKAEAEASAKGKADKEAEKS